MTGNRIDCNNIREGDSNRDRALGPARGRVAHQGLEHWLPQAPMMSLQPFDARRTSRRVEQHRVEPARRRCAIGARGNTAPPRRQPRALACAVMLAAAPPKSLARAQAHFDEHERVAVARDDVDLAAAAAEVALDDDEAARDEELRRRAPPRARRRRARAAVSGHRPARRGRRGTASAGPRGRTGASRRATDGPWRRRTRAVDGVPSANACATRKASMPSA